MTRFARLPERFRLMVCLFAAGMGCSSSSGTGLTLPTDTSGGTTSSTGGDSASGGVVGSGGVTGSGGSSIDLNGHPNASGGSGGIDGCVGTSSTATPLPPVLAFLIDTSSSMSDPPMGSAAGTPSKWLSTRDALIQAFTDMAAGTGTGLIFYPNVALTGGAPPPRNSGGFTGFGRGGSTGFGMGGTTGAGGANGGTTNAAGAAGANSSCINRQVAVPLAALDMPQRDRIVMALRNKNPSGHTPTHDAYKFALDTVEQSTLPGSKYVVLVTDGAPTFSLGCVGDGINDVDASPIVQEAAAALSRGIKTFVIGSPGSETARGSLSQMATQGGTALANCSDSGPNYCHFDMTTAPDLSAALNEAFKAITGQVVNCNYNIPSVGGTNVLDLDRVNVNYTTGAGQSTPIPRDPSSSDCNQGWQFSADKKQIMLCPDMCNTVKKDNGAKVDVVFGCKTITL